ncbi:MAG: hypothetical protein US76_04150 [Parcubacteria group bacterium GW2011_GWA2_38_13b]|nr:MAG: hypothetical protein US76_04150 [Parcubacteria group bacterium GW2011_GWA2_38_13b]
MIVIKRMILIFLSAFFIMSAVNTSDSFGKKKEEVVKQTEYQFYPHKQKSRNSPINKEQNWQLLYELLGRSQFAAVKGKWLDVLLGEKQELDPCIDTPIDIAVIEGKTFILDQERKSVWVYDFGGKKPELREIKGFKDDNFDGAYGMDTDGKLIYLSYPARQEIMVFDLEFNLERKIDCVFTPMRIKVSGEKLYVVDTGLQRNLNQDSPESVFVLNKETGEVLSVIGMPENIWKKFIETGDEKILAKKGIQNPVPFSAEAIKADHEKKKKSEDVLLCQPSDVDVDSNGNIYISEERGARILKFDPAGKFLDQYGIRGTDLVCFEEVVDIAIAPNGDIYALDAGITMKGITKGAVDIKSRPYIKFFSQMKWGKEKALGNLACLPHSVWGGESVKNDLVGGKMPNMVRPYKIVIDTIEANIEHFGQFVSPDFKVEYLVWIICQGGGTEKVAGKIIDHGKVMVFAYGQLSGK